MKTKKLIFAIICILSVTLSACKKEVSEVSPEFIGHWSSEHFGDGNFSILTIDENSNASYHLYFEGDASKEYNGTARADDKHFKIGRTMYFDIIEYPHLIDTSVEKHVIYNQETNQYILANWKMMLEGMKPEAFHVCERLEYYKIEY
jgi:hypothetical protein